MKRFMVAALALGSVCAGTAVHAASGDDVMARLAALEKENAAIRRENAALRENNALRAQNTALKSASAPAGGSRATDAKRDSFAAYAADLPTAYKARPRDPSGQLRVWGEGGAIWSGGDPVYSFYDRVSFTSTAQGVFALKPDTGWETAIGFDYRFAESPWHASAQFRYGEGRRSVSDSSTVLVPPASISTNATAAIRETHWLADIAVGRDVLGSDVNPLQLKFGLRVADLRAAVDAVNALELLQLPNFQRASLNDIQKNSFLGAGPRAGIEGSVQLGHGWAFDYLGDAAVLFGTQTYELSRFISNFATSVNNVTLIAPSTATAQNFKTVFNADLQVGVSYWVMPNVKVSASYRLDAYFNALSGLTIANDPTRMQSLDRYIHGPRVGVSATF